MLAVGITLGSFGLFVYNCLMQIAPDIVLPVFAVAGIVMGLNAFVFIYYCCRWVVVKIWRGLRWVFGFGRLSRGEVAMTSSQVAVKVPTVQVEVFRSTGEK